MVEVGDKTVITDVTDSNGIHHDGILVTVTVRRLSLGVTPLRYFLVLAIILFVLTRFPTLTSLSPVYHAFEALSHRQSL